MARQPGEWILNRTEGIDVLHPIGLEQCNLDQADSRQYVDEATGKAMIDAKTAIYCHHCGPRPEPEAA